MLPGLGPSNVEFGQAAPATGREEEGLGAVGKNGPLVYCLTGNKDRDKNRLPGIAWRSRGEISINVESGPGNAAIKEGVNYSSPRRSPAAPGNQGQWNR